MTSRLFTLGAGGNEGVAWLVDPRLVAAIVGSGLVNEAGLPVVAAREFQPARLAHLLRFSPFVGQPTASRPGRLRRARALPGRRAAG